MRALLSLSAIVLLILALIIAIPAKADTSTRMDTDTYAATQSLYTQLHDSVEQGKLNKATCQVPDAPQTGVYPLVKGQCLAAVVLTKELIKAHKCWQQSKSATVLGKCLATPVGAIHAVYALVLHYDKLGKMALAGGGCAKVVFDDHDTKRQGDAFNQVYHLFFHPRTTVKQLLSRWNHYVHVLSQGDGTTYIAGQAKFAGECSPVPAG